MEDSIFERRDGEKVRDWILRLHLDPWFEDATPAEIADFTGQSPELVRRTIIDWAKSSRVRRIHAHAQAVADKIDWPGAPEGLVHIALERYAQRWGERVSGPRVPLEKEIQEFLAKSSVLSEAEPRASSARNVSGLRAQSGGTSGNGAGAS